MAVISGFQDVERKFELFVDNSDLGGDFYY
jgi:hypothetical protein